MAGRLQAGGDPCEILDERFVTAFAVAGTPDDCLAAASRYADANVTQLALTFEAVDPTRAIKMLSGALKSDQAS